MHHGDGTGLVAAMVLPRTMVPLLVLVLGVGGAPPLQVQVTPLPPGGAPPAPVEVHRHPRQLPEETCEVTGFEETLREECEEVREEECKNITITR